MKVYFFKRVKGFSAILLMLFLFFFAIENFVEPNVFPTFLFLGFIAPMLFMRTNWFLIFPFSRKRLLFYHVFEVFVNAGLCFVGIFLMLLYHKSRFPDFDTNDSFSSTTYYAVFLFFVLAALNPIKNNVRKIEEIQFEKITNKKHRAFALVKYMLYLGFMMLMVRGTNGQGGAGLTLAILLAISVIPLAPLVPLKQLAMARASYNSLKRICFGLVAIALTSSIATLAYFAYSGNPRQKVTEYAFILLGELNAPLSQARIMDLAMVPKDAYKAYYKKLSSTEKEKITPADWIARAEECAKTDCLDGSAWLIPESLTITEKLDRFAVLMGRCYPGFKDDRLRCKGIKPSDWVIDSYIELLFQSPDLSDWLSGSDQLKQLIALRALSCRDVPKDIDLKANQLLKSPETYVQKAADYYISFYAKTSPKKDATDWCGEKFKYHFLF